MPNAPASVTFSLYTSQVPKIPPPSPTDSNGHPSPNGQPPQKPPPKEQTSGLIVLPIQALRKLEGGKNVPYDEAKGCPLGCGAAGLPVALLLWTPAMLVAHAGGVGGAAIGITILVSLFLAAFLFLGSRLALAGVAREHKARHLKPFVLFFAIYALTFLICLLITFFLTRARSGI